MSAIFISHSSQDDGLAADLVARLQRQGYRTIFLDLDPEVGIPAGRNWERELYAQLRSCHAVITLWSRHAMASKWCFAELAQASAMGKPIFPVKLDDAPLDPLIASYQAVDLAAEGEGAYGRLWAGLEASGLDPKASFGWDRARPPYPGLVAFEEEDAAVFFGRDAETRSALERLTRMRRLGGSRMLVVLGPSGSGKSSLVRAGVLPRLKRDPRNWLVLDVLRPRRAPLDELAIVLSRGLEAVGSAHSWTEIRASLLAASVDPSDAAGTLEAIAVDLLRAFGNRDACVVLTIDQMEEVLGLDPPDGAEPFLQLLRASLLRPDLPLVLLATLRSDFLGALQQHAALRDVPFEDVCVGPMKADGLVEVINGPARVAAIAIEAGLTEALLEDTETDDALPLLAYTLRELYERFGDDRTLELEEYREGLGGLTAGIAAAAESVLATDGSLDERLLRASFLRLVRINEEGKYARRSARWSDMPESLHGVLKRFVDARLLISGADADGPTLEVAHEALFRSWERLRGWLDEDREQLLWQQRMRAAVGEWERSGRDDGALLRGGRLAEALRWLDQTKTLSEGNSGALPDVIQEYVSASEAQRKADQARAESGRRRTVLVLAGGLTVAVVFGIFAVAQWQRATQQRRVADEQTRAAVARQLGAYAQLLVEDPLSEPVQRALLVAESLRRMPTLQAFVAWSELQSQMPRLMAELVHETETSLVAWNPDGQLVAVADADGVSIWRWSTHELLHRLPHAKPVEGIEFSPDGTLLATAERWGVAHLWDVTTGTEQARLEQLRGYGLLAFSPDGTLLATASDRDGRELGRDFHLWDTRTGERRTSLTHPGNSGGRQYLAFSPDGRAVATTGPDRSVRVWDVESSAEIARFDEPWGDYSLDFSPDGARLATGASWQGEVRVWDLETGSEVFFDTLPETSFVYVVRFGPDGRRLAAGGGGRWSSVWDVETGSKLFDMETVNNVRTLDFSPDGTLLASAASGIYANFANARLWDAMTGRELTGFAAEVAATDVAFSADGARVATAGGDETVRIWSTRGGSNDLSFEHGSGLMAFEFTPDGRSLVSAGDLGARVWGLDGQSSTELSYSTAGARGGMYAADLSPDGRVLVTGHPNRVAVLWDVARGDARARLEHEGAVWSVAFAPDGLTVASGGDDGTASIWAAEDGRRLHRLAHDDTVTAVAFSPDGARLATASLDRSVRIWDVATGTELLRLEHDLEALAVTYTPDGAKLAVHVVENWGQPWEVGQIQLWDAHTNERGPTLPHDELVYSVEPSPDGRWLVTASRDRLVSLWDVETGEPVLRLALNGPAHGASFSADSQWLVTWGAWDGPARVFEVETGREVARFSHGDTATIQNAGFSPDGSRVGTAGDDGTVRVWTWRADDLIADICSRVTRNLTEDEWRRFVGAEPYRSTCPMVETDTEGEDSLATG